MTIVFRTSTFFLVVVISVKTLSVMGSSLTEIHSSRFEHRVEQLLDESLRHRKEVDEIVEDGSNYVQALYSIANRSIIRGFEGLIGPSKVLLDGLRDIFGFSHKTGQTPSDRAKMHFCKTASIREDLYTTLSDFWLKKELVC